MPALPLNVTHACFGLSYALAWGCELARLRWGRAGLRTAALFAGAAGLLAHSLFLVLNPPPLAAPYGQLLGVAWVLAVVSVYGTMHHPKQAWGVFALPVVLLLAGLAFLHGGEPPVGPAPAGWLGEHFWGALHGVLLLLAAVGVSVGFLASVMYLVQASRLRAKVNPLSRFKLLSLERLEAMNRRAVHAAFPLLTLGLLLGVVLLRHGHDLAHNLFSPKVLGTVLLWLDFLLLLYLRYAAAGGRRLAAFTIAAFALMVLVLASAHPFAGAGP